MASEDVETWAQGVLDGQTWADATGFKSEDIRVPPAIIGPAEYHDGFRVGVYRVWRQRYFRELGIEGSEPA